MNNKLIKEQDIIKMIKILYLLDLNEPKTHK